LPAAATTARLFLCVRCQAQVLVCSHCDRGQIYCAQGCAQTARRDAQRAAGRRYQASRRGRVNHAARAGRYRAADSLRAYGGTERGNRASPSRIATSRKEGVMITTVAKTADPVNRAMRFDRIRPLYLEVLNLVERVHHQLLDVIKDEFERRGRADVNSVQALLLYNIGEKELTARELHTRGYYLGSNVSYNLKKLVELGFLDHQRSRTDRRSVRIKLADKGHRGFIGLSTRAYP
jgi:DNA-binding MarR family transcriptional regulator